MYGKDVPKNTLPLFMSEIPARGIWILPASPKLLWLLLFNFIWLLRKLQIPGPAQIHSWLFSVLKVTFKETAEISERLLHNSYVCVYILLDLIL